MDLSLIWGCTATAAYDLVLLGKHPSWLTLPLFLCGFAGLAFIWWKQTRAKAPSSAVTSETRPASGIFLLCGLCVLVNIFTNRPATDDLSYLPRALAQLSRLSEPFLRTYTALDIDTLPPLSPFHLFTAYEPVTMLLAHILGLPPVAFLTWGAGSAGAALLPIAYHRLLRYVGFSWNASLWGTAAIVLWLLFSGDTHRDWGNFTLLRIWEGKCILVGAFLPAALLFLIRFMRDGATSDVIRLHACMFLGIGLTGSTLFMLPWTISMTALGLWIASPHRRQSFWRGLWASSIGLQSIAAWGLVQAGWLPAVHDVRIYWDRWATDPLDLLGLVLSPATVVLGSLFSLAALYLTPQRRLVTGLILSSILSISLLLLPWTGSALLDLVQPAAFWRFAYTLPFPLFVGLAGAGAARLLNQPQTRQRSFMIWGAVMAFVVGVLAWKTPALRPSLMDVPQTAKVDHAVLARMSQLSGQLPASALVLAPQQETMALALIRPDLRFVSTRPYDDTLTVFRNGGRAAAGDARSQGQQRLGGCHPVSSDLIQKMDLARPIDLIVPLPGCPADRVSPSPRSEK